MTTQLDRMDKPCEMNEFEATCCILPLVKHIEQHILRNENSNHDPIIVFCDWGDGDGAAAFLHVHNVTSVLYWGFLDNARACGMTECHIHLVDACNKKTM
jgi:hypothetical protein